MPTTRATELAQVGSLVSADPSASTVTVSGSVVTNAGTAAAPAVVPTGDLNTGMFFPAADTIAFSEGGAEAMRIDSSGNVGIGTTSPSARLSISFNGTSIAGSHFINTDSGSSTHNYALFYRNTSTLVGSIQGTNNATSYNTSSDYRLKINLDQIQNGINRIKQLPVYRFNWLNDPSGNRVDGFLAHEAKEIVPECVVGEKDAVDAEGKPIYQGIDQSKIVPLLTAALKEAIAKIETLEAKVAALEAA